MHQSGKAIGFWSAISLGMGAMVGAGIFALLGQASAIAGSAVYLSFLAGGIIALLSGYSLARLGVRYPAACGIVEYLVQCFGEGYFSGAMSVMLYLAALISLSLIARTFGSYASLLLPDGFRSVSVPLLSGFIMVMFTWINEDMTALPYTNQSSCCSDARVMPRLIRAPIRKQQSQLTSCNKYWRHVMIVC